MSDSELTLAALSLGGDAVARSAAAGEAAPAAADAALPAGRAHARIPGGTVTFVPYGAPGDRVLVERREVKKNFSRAWIASVAAPSEHRIEPPCPYFYRPGAAPETVCGGCNWQHLKYEFQAETKRKLLEESFQRLGKIPKPNVEPTIIVDNPSGAPSPLAAEAVTGEKGADGPWRYRNKVQIPFATVNDRLVGGFYAPNSHTIVPFEDCIVQSEASVRIFRAVLEWFRAHPVRAYDEGTHHGWLRHLLIRTNSRNEALVALITNGDQFPDALGFAKHLTTACPEVRALFHNVNTRTDHVILGPEWRHLHGKHFLTEHVLGLKFRLSPGSFFQVHHAMAEKLYQKVEDFVQPQADEGVLELYAGVGAMAQILAKRARNVWGVEENQQAVADAIESAKWNDIKNVKFLAQKCETALARGRFKHGPADRIGAVVLDPPRAGCEQHVLRGVMRLEPKRIVYVSCDPATLARDARYLSTGGYLLKRCVPVDLFPQTSHIESVSLFLPRGKQQPASGTPQGSNS